MSVLEKQGTDRGQSGVSCVFGNLLSGSKKGREYLE
jgi:hypothetical protein